MGYPQKSNVGSSFSPGIFFGHGQSESYPSTSQAGHIDDRNMLVPQKQLSIDGFSLACSIQQIQKYLGPKMGDGLPIDPHFGGEKKWGLFTPRVSGPFWAHFDLLSVFSAEAF